MDIKSKDSPGSARLSFLSSSVSAASGDEVPSFSSSSVDAAAAPTNANAFVVVDSCFSSSSSLLPKPKLSASTPSSAQNVREQLRRVRGN